MAELRSLRSLRLAPLVGTYQLRSAAPPAPRAGYLYVTGGAGRPPGNKRSGERSGRSLGGAQWGKQLAEPGGASEASGALPGKDNYMKLIKSELKRIRIRRPLQAGVTRLWGPRCKHVVYVVIDFKSLSLVTD